VAVRGRVVLEGIRIARNIATDPSGVVILWKAAMGGKAAGCMPAAPVPELLLAADLLPIALESPEDMSLLSGQVDAWVVGSVPDRFPIPDPVACRFALPRSKPSSVEEALDRLEALAEWACDVSGTPASEGSLWKSIRAYAARRSLLDALDDRCSRDPGFLAADERRAIVRAGNFLPPEAHSRILSFILGIDGEPPGIALEGEKGDPLIVLARRIAG